jgi:hypothetical protein
VLRDIEPHLKDVANGHAVAHNDSAKHGFVALWNTHIDVRIDVSAVSRMAKLLQNLRIDTLKASGLRRSRKCRSLDSPKRKKLQPVRIGTPMEEQFLITAKTYRFFARLRRPSENRFRRLHEK